eukprot:1074581-Amorphochlora_amoeboformis.AAC.1
MRKTQNLSLAPNQTTAKPVLSGTAYEIHVKLTSERERGALKRGGKARKREGKREKRVTQRGREREQ